MLMNDKPAEYINESNQSGSIVDLNQRSSDYYLSDQMVSQKQPVVSQTIYQDYYQAESSNSQMPISLRQSYNGMHAANPSNNSVNYSINNPINNVNNQGFSEQTASQLIGIQ